MDEMTEEQRSAMNSVFRRIQELDYENKQLTLERAKLSQRVDELEMKLRNALVKIERQDTLDTEYLDAFRVVLRAELDARLPTPDKKKSKAKK